MNADRYRWEAEDMRDDEENDDAMYLVIGQRIREARRARNLSLAQLGGSDLSRSFLSLAERGRTRISLRALALIARRLQLPISYFLDGVEPSHAREQREPETHRSGPPSWTIRVSQPIPGELTINLSLLTDLTDVPADAPPLIGLQAQAT